MLEVLIGAFILVFLAVAGMGIKLLFNKNAEFTGGSCQTSYKSADLSEKGISCGCGGQCASDSK